MRRLPLALVALLGGSLAPTVLADDPAPAPAPLPGPPAPAPKPAAKDDTQSKVLGWIADLSSDDFRTRESASKSLAEAGEAARAALEAAAKTSDSLEVRWRAQQLLMRLEDRGERAFDAPGEGEAKPPLPPMPGVPGTRDPRMDEFQRRMEKVMRELMERMGRVPDRGGRGGASPFAQFEPTLQAGEFTLTMPLFGEGVHRLTRRTKDGTLVTYVGAGLDEILSAHPDLKDAPGFADLQKQVAERKKRMDAPFPGLTIEPGSGGSITFGNSQGVRVRQDGNGAVVDITTTGEDGQPKTTTFKGATLEDIKREHPELAKQIDSVNQFQVHFGPPRLFGGPREQGLAPMPPAPPELRPTTPTPALPAFGLYVGPVEPVLALHLGLPEGHGALVLRVEPGSQAEQMGLQQFDVIESIGGTPITSQEQAVRALRGAAKDRASLSLGIVRAGKRQTLAR